MNEKQWQAVCAFRKSFKADIEQWKNELNEAGALPLLTQLVKQTSDAGGVPEYPLENLLVYNTSLDAVTRDDEIKLIVIGDNPGKDEQRACNQKYLVGQAGKLAASFFRAHPELGIDFRKNVIILNKTPVHSAKTKDLRAVLAGSRNALAQSDDNAGQTIRRIVEESQTVLASRTATLHAALNDDASSCGLWLVGYAELRDKGLFTAYRDALVSRYKDSPLKERLFVFQHFSMNRFSIDLKAFCASFAAGVAGCDAELTAVDVSAAAQKKQPPLAEAIAALGTQHRREILGI